MQKILFALLVYGVLLFIAHPANSDTLNAPNKSEIELVSSFLEAMNSGDETIAKEFVSNNFSASLIEKYSIDIHADYLINLYRRFGELTFQRMIKSDKKLSESILVAEVSSESTELWETLTIYRADDNPDKIRGLSLAPLTPSNQSKTASISLNKALEEIDAYVKRMAKKDIFSGSVLLAKNEKVLYSGAYGMASKRFNVANNLQTKFNVGSMNKMFTAIGIMQLIQAGKLSLSDKLSKFVDESWLPAKLSSKIEIQHLLTHSSGLGSYFIPEYFDASRYNFRALSDYKKLMVKEELQFEPSTDSSYSNSGMLMLGVVIEKVSGQDYFQYIREKIYLPVGMTNSDSYEMDQPIPNLAIGYERSSDNKTGWVNNLFFNAFKGAPAGSGFSTVEDLHRFSLALTNYKLLNEKLTNQLYSAKPKMHSPEYGYGFRVNETDEDRIVGHDGDFDGVSSNLDIYLDRGYIAAVLSNYGNGSRPIERKIRELLALVKE